VFPVETRAPVIVQERARGFWKFCASRTAYFQPDAMRCSGRWMIFVFIIIVSITLVLGMAFLVTRF
jgi:hypothetical protein